MADPRHTDDTRPPAQDPAAPPREGEPTTTHQTIVHERRSGSTGVVLAAIVAALLVLLFLFFGGFDLFRGEPVVAPDPDAVVVPDAGESAPAPDDAEPATGDGATE
ncbi:hypothetical protein N1F89_05635 [Aquibium sp. A9E412]|uniref:hypothetical protein n=1 Tax=Aquibium sp. A9E412 TaxID=2976767 RepID=UPI0025B0E9E3|nr:hypothetical protein [Aquibium sp. A9E412]MDN2565696.1 hypothetical protein [Aquibium sp. A9E412]